jgi:hypothetical protein
MNNTFSSAVNVYDVNGTRYAYGIWLRDAIKNKFTSPQIVTNITAKDLDAYGFYLASSNENEFSLNTIANITGNRYACGFQLSKSMNNSINHTEIHNVQAGTVAAGINLSSLPSGSDKNIFNTGSISNISAAMWWSIVSCEHSASNVFSYYTLSSYPTTTSFTYNNGIKIKSVETPLPNPEELLSTGKYLNITNVTRDSWINLTIHYTNADVRNINENSLGIYRWNGTGWELVPSISNPSQNFAQGNISTFSQFSLFGSQKKGQSTGVPTLTPIGSILLVTLLLTTAIIAIKRRERYRV